MKQKVLQLAALVLAGLSTACQAGSRADLVTFAKTRCYVTTTTGDTVNASDSLVCIMLVQDAEPGDTTDVEKK
jgi:hypothetical protein